MPGVGPGESVTVGGRVAGLGADRMVARPELFARLGGPARVTLVSAPPGSGKTVLLRSWINQAGLAQDAAWVAVAPAERDPQRFWLSVVGALRGCARGSALVRAVTTAPDLDGWALVERLLTDLAPLRDRIWLVVDDVHELGTDALRQLELLIMRAPAELRFVLATRHDVRLGLHRLRLEGELAEIRESDLRFTLAEASELFAAAEAELPGPAVAILHERTEGWAAGLRLAALSLGGHPDPARFAAEFSGSERTVAEYLLAEVLDRQSEEVRRLLLRTSILEQVNGELADLLAGGSGGERMLQDLELAGAFTMSLDPTRSWFRYHQMFADLLRLELRRTAPAEVTALHQAASGWFAGRGHAVEAIRHAQAAREWGLATRLLADHWPSMHLDGQDAATHELLAGFPAGAAAADAELAALAAADELAYGTLEAAERYLNLADRRMASVSDARRGQARILLAIARLRLARQRGSLQAVLEEWERLQAAAEAAEAARPGFGEDLRALALISVGTAEFWAARFSGMEQHLEQGVTLARRIGRPYLEFIGLAYQAAAAYQSSEMASDRGRQAVGLAEQHGWTDDPAFGIACLGVGAALTGQGLLDLAEPWIQRAERTVRAETEPAVATATGYVRGTIELAHGRNTAAVAASLAVERLGRLHATTTRFVPPAQAQALCALVRLGDVQGAEQALAKLGEADGEFGEIRVAAAELRLAQDDPRAATKELAPVLAGSVPVSWYYWLARAYMLEAIATDALGDSRAAEQALEHALEVAEPNAALLPFLLYPAPGLLERHRRRTAHAALITEVLSLLAGNEAAPQGARPRPLDDPLSGSELRVLRYLPTNLTAPEIASELSVSQNTVKTHVRNLYAKLGTHGRAEAVARARDLGLLAPSTVRR